MKSNIQSQFQTRQHMLSDEFELYYYNDSSLGKVDWHSHNYYEFYIFLEGDVAMQIGATEYEVHLGDIMMIPPHLSHRLIIRNQNVPYRRFVFWISEDYYRHLGDLSKDYLYLMEYAKRTSTYWFQLDQIQFNEVQSKMLHLIDEIHSEHFGRDAQIPLLSQDLILHLSRVIYQQHHPKESSGELELYQNIALYIDQHLDEDLSLETLAQQFYVSRYHIAHIFKENLGMSIHQFITKKRLSRCKQAISGSSNITEVYQAWGFGDYSSFYRAFKKEYGISPKDYKNMQKLDV